MRFVASRKVNCRTAFPGRLFDSTAWKSRPTNVFHNESDSKKSLRQVPAGGRPDGRFVAAAGYHGEVRIWDPKDPASLARFRAHRGAVQSLDFSPDSKRLVTAGSDSTIVVWDVEKLIRER